MSYYSNIDLDNWKENAVLYNYKWFSQAEYVEWYNKHCWNGQTLFASGINDPDKKKINITHLQKLVTRWLNHKEAWREKKEQEFNKKYPNIELYILEKL